MSKKLANKYSFRYGMPALLFLIALPVIIYFFSTHSSKDMEVRAFHSMSEWSGICIIGWLVCSGFLYMESHWSLADKPFQDYGFTFGQRLSTMWGLVFMTALIGGIIAMFTFVNLLHTDKGIVLIKILTLVNGFIPITFYVFLRARRNTQHISGESIPQLPPYVELKYFTLTFLVINFFLTPFLGVWMITGRIWHLKPRLRFLINLALVSWGVFTTLAMKPLLVLLKDRTTELQAFAMYTTFSLFSTVSYIIIYRILWLLKKRIDVENNESGFGI